MNVPRLSLLACAILLASCSSAPQKGTIADLRQAKLELADEKIEGGIEKAMQGYQKFLEETPESSMTPEALRRLADLKLEREYGVLEKGAAHRLPLTATAAVRPERAQVAAAAVGSAPALAADPQRENSKSFEQRATQAAAIPVTAAIPDADGADLSNAGATEAIALYKQLLEKYPHYPRNDQVLYQLARAHEELGQVDAAMAVMNRIARDYPASRYSDEIQFRRGEYHFTRKQFLPAEGAYQAIVKAGAKSFYYELALYKLGWSFYKQEMHEEALQQFTALLDHKIATGYDFEKPKDEFEAKRVEDTYRVISLSFSAQGGADAIVAHFKKHGRRNYEVDVYRNLGEHYLEKRRYADAAAAYRAFVQQNPYHQVAPHFDMRVIAIYRQGGFPQLVTEANKAFATDYGLKAVYWTRFDVNAYPDVLGHLKTNLKELANHYHALYQEPQFAKAKPENFREASHWYSEFLESFPKDAEAPVMNYQLADLLLENRAFAQAAAAYERAAYDYPAHEKAAAAGYAAVYAWREHLAAVAERDKEGARQQAIRSSLRFAEAFPQHEKAALAMGAALEDIYGSRDYTAAQTTGRRLLALFPTADPALRRGAWLVVAHSAFELAQYAAAEEGYGNVLQLTAADASDRAGLVENLAASVYKQGEQAQAAGDLAGAATQFLRVGQVAPTSKIRPTADYDGGAVLIQLKDWERAATVLHAFRQQYPGHTLQPDVTRKIAHVFHEAGKLAQAAAEYERIETETRDETLRREALQVAADLHLKAGAGDRALLVYARFLGYFPRPLEPAVETRHKIATLLKARNDSAGYQRELKAIVATDAKAGAERSDRIRYLAATAALILAEPTYAQYAEIKLTQPFDKSLKKKKAAMKSANDVFGKLLAYEVGEVTSAATFYIAEAYTNFSTALKQSERPGDLDELEKEQYEEALDEQSYPFEEKGIQIHEKNAELISRGVYNAWVDKSMGRLAELMPGRYAKFEESTGFIPALEVAGYQEITEPPAPAPAPLPAAPASGTPAAAQPVVDAAPASAPPADDAAPVAANAATAIAAPLAVSRRE
ncbi:MAG: tetratricopeptide repeat protein [Pseudomonadota bacterium]